MAVPKGDPGVRPEWHYRLPHKDLGRMPGATLVGRISSMAVRREHLGHACRETGHRLDRAQPDRSRSQGSAIGQDGDGGCVCSLEHAASDSLVLRSITSVSCTDRCLGESALATLGAVWSTTETVSVFVSPRGVQSGPADCRQFDSRCFAARK